MCIRDSNDTGLIFQTKDKSITNHKWADKFISAFSKQFDMHVIQDNPTFKDIVIDDELSSFSNRYADVESTIYCNCNYHIDDLRKLLGDEFVVTLSSFKAVSYTHLDVYKRQLLYTTE